MYKSLWSFFGMVLVAKPAALQRWPGDYQLEPCHSCEEYGVSVYW